MQRHWTQMLDCSRDVISLKKKIKKILGKCVNLTDVLVHDNNREEVLGTVPTTAVITAHHLHNLAQQQ